MVPWRCPRMCTARPPRSTPARSRSPSDDGSLDSGGAGFRSGAWRAVRAADGASLENWWAEMSRGFESHALRQGLRSLELLGEHHENSAGPAQVGELVEVLVDRHPA